MRIHSDTLMYADFHHAAMLAGVDVIELEHHGSKSRHHAFTFSLTGSSPYQRGFGASKNGEKAGSWDEWGMFLAHLFNVDPKAHTGKHGYESRDHFHWMTANRFMHLTPSQQHRRHKWGMGLPSPAYAYSVSYCDCGAERRWLLNTTWNEFAP